MGKLRNKNLTQAVIVISAFFFGSSLLFQNCSKISVSDIKEEPSIGIDVTQGEPEPTDPLPIPIDQILHAQLQPEIYLRASLSKVIEGQSSTVTITFKDLENISYICSDRVTQEILASGSIPKSGHQLEIKVDRDLHCEATGNIVGTTQQRKASGDLTVDCANRIKNTAQNKCQDFSCQKVIELQAGTSLVDIPARNSDGICYAIKLLNRIDKGDSILTKTSDSDVISRNHGKGPSPHHPFDMGSVKAEFRIEGPRVMKLSGALSATEPILVDNFILMGLFPSNIDPNSALPSFYQVMGTADSSIPGAEGGDSKSIDFKGTLLPVKDFGPSGTSSVAPIDISKAVKPMEIQTLDLRALDCGGVRELSDVYLLFQ